jgi:hypothetical protein
MADLPLDVLIKPLTKEQVRATILDLCVQYGLRTRSWQPGGVTRTLIAVISQLFATFSGGVAKITRSGFLDLADGPYLTLLAYFGYGVQRILATFAAGNCTVTNTGGGLYSFEVGEFIAKSSTTEVTYTNTAAFTLQPVGNLGSTAPVPMQAQVAGAAGTAGVHDIDELVTVAIGVEIDNEAALVGIDAELDEDLRERCRDKLGALSPNGAKDAYRYVARSAVNDDGAPIGVNRVKIKAPDGSGKVDVWVATKSGALAGSDLVALRGQIQRLVVPDSVDAEVHNSTNVAQNLTVDIYVDQDSGRSDDEWQTLVENTMLEYWPKVPIGGYVLSPPSSGRLLYRAIEAAITSRSPQIFEAIVSNEVDHILGVAEVATPGNVNVNVNRVAA